MGNKTSLWVFFQSFIYYLLLGDKLLKSMLEQEHQNVINMVISKLYIRFHQKTKKICKALIMFQYSGKENQDMTHLNISSLCWFLNSHLVVSSLVCFLACLQTHTHLHTCSLQSDSAHQLEKSEMGTQERKQFFPFLPWSS